MILTINSDNTVDFVDELQKWSASRAKVIDHGDGTYSFTFTDSYVYDQSEYQGASHNPYVGTTDPVERVATFRFENGLLYLNPMGTEFPLLKPTEGLSFTQEGFYAGILNEDDEFMLEISADGTVFYYTYVYYESMDDYSEIYAEECPVAVHGGKYYFLYDDPYYGPTVVSFAFNADGTITLKDDAIDQSITLELSEMDDYGPETDTPYLFGMTQENLDFTDYFLAGGMNSYYMATTDDAEAALLVYLEETEGGYYLYCYVDEVKTYINMVISGTHVNGAYEEKASTVYTYDVMRGILVTMVNDVEYTFGTRNDKDYTTIGPVATKYNGFWATFYYPPEDDEPTEPPATNPPATNPPATNPPATNPPATNPPATNPPATNPPATNPPATNPPATDPSVSHIGDFEKVTQDLQDWTGTYLITYEKDGQLCIFNGVDEKGNFATTLAQACLLVVEKCGDGYSFRLVGGANSGKYLAAKAGKNAIVFNDTPVALTLAFNGENAVIKDGKAPFQFNNGDGDGRFRFFGKNNGGQSEIDLYRLKEDPSAPTEPTVPDTTAPDTTTPVEPTTTAPDTTAATTPTEPPVPTTTTPSEPEPGANEPKVDTAYKFGMVQEKKDNKTYYLVGGMDSFYFATTDKLDEALDVYLEATEGGYYLYCYVDTVKTYINCVVNDGHINGAYEETASTVYTYDAQRQILLTIVNDEQYTFGTRKDRTYTNIGPVKVEYDGFWAKFYPSDGTSSDPTTPTEPTNPTDPSAPTEPGGNTLTISIAEIAKENSWENGTQYSLIEADGVTITAEGAENTGKYYSSNHDWRIYQSETGLLVITADEGKTIASVKITYTVKEGGVLLCGDTQVESGKTFTVNDDTVTFDVGNTGDKTKGKVLITSIEITFA